VASQSSLRLSAGDERGDKRGLQPSVHYRCGLAHLRHNLTTLKFDKFRRGMEIMRGRVSSAIRRFAPVCAAIVLCLSLAHCSNTSNVDPRYGVSPSARLVEPGEPVPKGGGVYRVGSPYTVGGRVYVPQDDPRYRAEGLASWYGSDFHGRATANGEIFDADSISAAHPTLPLPSYVRVTNLGNSHSIIVRVNDRGPYHGNRIIDVSKKTAHLLGFTVRGTASVRVEYVGRAPIEGSDDRLLEATLRENGPAPSPDDGKVAATSIAPNFPAQPAPARNPRFASASAPEQQWAPPGAALSYTGTASATSESTQLLSGRGLY
jgi:rare lipoprotein A